jgi:citrate lyase beta subunit
MKTLLFVPASRPAMIEKAAASAADAVCLDLEDSVAPADKAASRDHVVRSLREIDFGRRARVVRINGLDTAYAYRDLIDIVEAAGDRLDLVMVPKVSGPRDVAFVETLLSQIEWHRQQRTPIRIEAQIETAHGFLYAREIAGASARLDALIFGPGDYSASMQMPSVGIGEHDRHDEVYPGHRWHAVMHTIVAAARAHGLRCMDGPYGAYKDAVGFERSCRIARALGFDGKQCIHPAQLAAANAIFSPSDEEVAHAQAVVQAYDAAIASGHGAATHEGKMIDAANLRMARAMLQRAQR